jgi:hypothetical protein
MANIRFRKLNFTNATADDLPRLLMRLTNNIDDSITPLINSVTSTTTMLKGIELKAGKDNYINHLLNKEYLTWWIGKPSEFCSIKESATINNMKDKHIILNTDVDVTVDIFVL